MNYENGIKLIDIKVNLMSFIKKHVHGNDNDKLVKLDSDLNDILDDVLTENDDKILSCINQFSVAVDDFIEKEMNITQEEKEILTKIRRKTMKKNYTALTLIVDRSGSMSGSESDTIGGMNSLIESQQKVDGDVSFTLVLFDNLIETIHDFVDLKTIKKIDEKTYNVRGSTSLLDAIGITCNKLGKRLSDLPEEERPSTVIVAIITDGMENASREFTKDQIKELVKHQTESYNWDFNFISANLDQYNDALTMGFGQGTTAMYDKNLTSSAYAAMSCKFTRARAGESLNFSEQELTSMAGVNTVGVTNKTKKTKTQVV
jgi:uncharacterized protein YegL